MENLFFSVKKCAGFGDQRERLTHTHCSIFYIVQVLPRSALWDRHTISGTSHASHNGTLLAYGLWMASASFITSETRYKERLCFLYILLLPPAVCRQRWCLRIGILTSVLQHRQLSGNVLEASSWAKFWLCK